MKKIQQFILKGLLCFVFSENIILVAAQEHKMPFQANWESLSKYQCPDWFRDAKFGIFIHWGVYSVPAYEIEWSLKQGKFAIETAKIQLCEYATG
jgi:hypothetical protein